MDKKEIVKRLIERDGLKCSISGEEISDLSELEIDHITPLSRGGTNDLDNLRLVKKANNKQVNNRVIGALAGGAILGASLFGVPGALIGGIAGVFLGDTVIKHEEDNADG
ncbi:MAG: HNH endonuclease [Pseudodesulfovibrio sp.]|uniref:HNH endonuclease n=1 Tax=Pseudodesulfovibrio sp. TaxID=2035812 RepID=UPI003D0F779B